MPFRLFHSLTCRERGGKGSQPKDAHGSPEFQFKPEPVTLKFYFGLETINLNIRTCRAHAKPRSYGSASLGMQIREPYSMGSLVRAWGTRSTLTRILVLFPHADRAQQRSRIKINARVYAWCRSCRCKFNVRRVLSGLRIRSELVQR